MSVSNIELLNYLNELLKPEKIKDYCPNGLQVEGKAPISRVVTGVTATQALIDRAVALNADAIFVHHGYFWKGENPCITGMKRRRLQTLLKHDINLYAYHLPLDVHPEMGNNAQLANLLGITAQTGLDSTSAYSVAFKGEFATPVSLQQLSQRVAQVLAREPMSISGGEHLIKTIAWCTGGGQSFIDMAAEQQIDAFLSGEISEQTVHTAREMNIHFLAAGHHATERYGAKAVGEHLAKVWGLNVEFVDVDNPA